MSLTRLKPTGIAATAQFSMANLAVTGNVSGDAVKTDNILHANGVAYDFTTYPTGSNTEIAFNDAGVFGSNANLTFNKSTTTLATDNVVVKNLTGNIVTAVQSNITSVGTLSSLAVAGDSLISGALTVSGNLTVSGTTTTLNSTTLTINDLNVVLANNATTSLAANGAGITINGASANLLYNNISNSFTFSHPITANGALLTSITGANVTGQVANALVAGTVYTAAQPSITSVGTLTSLAVTGNIVGANLTGNHYGNGSALTNLNSANITGQVANSLIAGTVYTNAQPNITSVGTLSSLAISSWFSCAQATESVYAMGAVAASTINYNMNNGATFYHPSVTLGANWTVNFQNVPTTDAKSIIVTIMVVQGATPYIPNVLQIDGTILPIKWPGGITPPGKVDSVDVFSFGLIRTGAAWAHVLGSYSTYS